LIDLPAASCSEKDCDIRIHVFGPEKLRKEVRPLLVPSLCLPISLFFAS